MRTILLQLILGLSWYNGILGNYQLNPFRLYTSTNKENLIIKWNNPVNDDIYDDINDDINDVIMDYKVLAYPVGPTYKSPAYCNLFDTKIFNETVESSSFDKTLTVSQNTEYDVVVVARNEEGLDLYSQSSFIGSDFSDDTIKDSAVRVQILSLPNNVTTNKYLTRVSSAIPCDVNMEKLEIEINARQKPVNRTSHLNYTIQRDFELDTGRYYQVYLTDADRKSSKFSISNPPAFKENIKKINIKGIRQEQIILELPYISDAKEYAVLIQEKGCRNTTTPKSGYHWSVDENMDEKMLSWKNVSDLPCIMLYQVKQKPTQKKRGLMRIEIGIKSDCSKNQYCNGPLRPGTTYRIALRVFTETSYYDSKFEEFTTHKYYGALTIFLLFTILLSAAMFLFIYTLTLDNPLNFKLSVPRKSDEFYHFYSKKKEYSDVFQQYSAIESIVPNETFDVAMQHKHLNRYSNIHPYDRNRVELNPCVDHRNTYINASFIEGVYYSREYIAAQGPKPETCLDFWRMVLQLDIDTIVMLTQTVESNKPKCHKYYPEKGEDLVISDDMQVFCKSEEIAPNNIYKKKFLEVKKDESSHEVCHYLFMNWPDHDVPENPNDLIKIVRDVRQDRKKPHVPLLVHCSAGVGRTGTFIALDIIIEKLENIDGMINIFEVVSKLREQRVKMVQAPSQYKLLYDCTFQLCKDSLNPGTRTTRI